MAEYMFSEEEEGLLTEIQVSKEEDELVVVLVGETSILIMPLVVSTGRLTPIMVTRSTSRTLTDIPIVI